LIRTALLAALVAVLLTATEQTDFEPDGVQVAVAAAYAVGFVSLGVLGGFRALPIFAVAYVGAAMINQWFFWHDDPTRSGTDDMDPLAGVFFVLPFALIAIAIAAGVTRLVRRATLPLRT
jgi:hypothetical protein